MLRQSCIVLMVSRTRIPTSANQQNFSIRFSSRERKKKTAATKGKANQSDLRAIVRDDPLKQQKKMM